MIWYVAALARGLPAAAARRDRPDLRGRPIILAAAGAAGARVAPGSDGPAQVGARLRRALVACPGAAALPDRPERTARALAELRALLARVSPRLLALAQPPDACLGADLGRLALPDLLAALAEIGAAARGLGLGLALGAAATPGLAQLAAQLAPADAALVVRPELAARMLAPLPPACLPIDAALAERLGRLGLTTVGALAALAPGALAAQLGAAGARLALLARGQIDAPQAAPLAEGPRISARRRFAGPLADMGQLTLAARQLAARLAAQLDRAGWAASELTLALECDAGPPICAARQLAEPTADAARVAGALAGLLDALAAELPAHSLGAEALVAGAAQLTPTQARQLALLPADAPGQGGAALGELAAQLGPRFAGRLLRAQAGEAAAGCLEQRAGLRALEGA